jgi:hypothetical protein
MSVCLFVPACISAAPTGRISVKFDIGAYDNLSKKPNLVKIGLKCRALCMKTYVRCTVAGFVNPPLKHSLRVKCYLTVGMA